MATIQTLLNNIIPKCGKNLKEVLTGEINFARCEYNDVIKTHEKQCVCCILLLNRINAFVSIRNNNYDKYKKCLNIVKQILAPLDNDTDAINMIKTIEYYALCRFEKI